MLHRPGFAAERPVKVPFLIGADGPKGAVVAQSVGDGLFAAALPNAAARGWHALLQFGTVLKDGEDVGSERVLEAAGHGVAVVYHALYERGGPDAVRNLPGGTTWLAGIEAVPATVRHLATHDGHLVELTERDRTAVQEGAELISSFTLTGPAEVVRQRVADLGAIGVTEVVYQPAGADIPGELERFIAAVS
jgi:5,10-methylenetetrahydromethanopterin reductase